MNCGLTSVRRPEYQVEACLRKKVVAVPHTYPKYDIIHNCSGLAGLIPVLEAELGRAER